ncbi:MAG: hypothetical protein IPN76_03455 [Saprospiraceae bacterium]|nr:hypothetical protein [Saprospiraceae bacterium]
MTNAAGQYGVRVPTGSDVTVTPVLDENPLNGVSTFDLVLISKHILGVTPLGSPYKIIAADANRSNSVTTFDLVEIRKLILFINSDFPNNTSWRFVDAAHSFANPANPFAASFPEVVNLNDVVVDQLNRDFVAVKVGDVNGSAAVNLLGSAEERNKVGDLVLNADDMELVAGQEYTVEFKATDFNVSGYQFSMNFDAKALGVRWHRCKPCRRQQLRHDDGEGGRADRQLEQRRCEGTCQRRGGVRPDVQGAAERPPERAAEHQQQPHGSRGVQQPTTG